MQNIIFEKPYEFIPPHRGNLWPTVIQRFKLFEIYLRRSAGVTSYEIRNADRLRGSLAAGHGILLTPNHSRPCDPMALGWLAGQVHTHLFAMASWHLFQQDRFTAFAIRKMGGFSVYREGVDRKAINTAIEILTAAERPLVLFPEGAVTRTNDKLSALMDGVAFIARTAAKRRKKVQQSAQVVVHPVAIKYLFRGDLQATLSPVLNEIEHRFSWRPQDRRSLLDRIRNVGYGLLALKEVEYFGQPQVGKLADRLQGLIDQLLHPLEQEWLGSPSHGPVVPRIKSLRMKILPDMVEGKVDERERQRRWDHLAKVYLSQQVFSYPPDYLTSEPTVDRLLETVERYEEDLTDEVRVHGNLHVIIDVGDAIEVSEKRDRTAAFDPLMRSIETDLQSMLDELALESETWSPDEGGEDSTKRTVAAATS